MRTSILFAATLTLFAACTTEDARVHDGGELAPLTKPGHEIIVAPNAIFHIDPSAEAQLPDDSTCDRLPSVGACSLACDPEGFSAQIPLGTCATFTCPLTGGGHIIVGGCRLDDQLPLALSDVASR